MPPVIVWLKRDLRLHDHPALYAASQAGPVLLLYVIEPELWLQPDAARQHYEFVRESLAALDRKVAGLGGRLGLRVGPILEVLSDLRQRTGFCQLFSHEETGNGWSYARDRSVARWCRAHGVHWTELPQSAVVRRLASRDAWGAHWQAFMGQDALPIPTLQWAPAPGPEVMAPEWHTLAPQASRWQPPLRQQGGRVAAIQVLDAFLSDRAQGYRSGISSPLSATSACSRLSPYLALGCLSVREVLQATQRRAASLPTGHFKRSLQSFERRLHWRDHFIQKLESEPAIEWHNMHRGYDGLREADWQSEHFERLQQGRTGWPLVDACVAMLHETGWLNFRMRAMLVSVAAYPLWLHWREVGLWLAREFLDYEPGIHWPQMQMQSGTTGINTTRVYNPIKQAQDQDPQGHFVRHWLPAMRQVPDAWLLEPWRMPEALQRQHGIAAGGLPCPSVDWSQAARAAKARLHQRRQQPEVRAGKQAVVDQHGSRLGHQRRRVGTRATHRSADQPTQQCLDF